MDQRSHEPTIRESKSKLLEAAQAAIADQRAKAVDAARAQAARSRGRNAFRVTLGLLSIGGSAVLAARPAWLVGAKLPSETAEVKSASVTLSLVEAMGH